MKTPLLDLARNKLKEDGLLDTTRDNALEMLSELSSESLPKPMQRVAALYTICTFVGHFKYKMKLAPDDIQPVNMIAFGLAHSGSGKSSSIASMQEALKGGYDIIESHRYEKEAIKAAAVGCDVPPLEDLTMGLSTTEGIAARLVRFSSIAEIGLPTLLIDEVANAFKQNEDIVGNMRLIAELFDKGYCAEKVIKDRETATPAIYDMGVSALFLGAEDGIMNDKVVMDNFVNEFTSKYARRGWFVYPEFENKEERYKTIEDYLDEEDMDDESIQRRKEILSTQSKLIANKAIAMPEMQQRIVDISPELKRVMKTYKAYCQERAKLAEDKLIELELAGRDWKVLKVACALSVFNGHTELMIQDLKAVITVAEENGYYIPKFVEKARRLPYEILVDKMLEEGRTQLTFHELNKANLGKTVQVIKNLVLGANSVIGERGIFECTVLGDVFFTDKKAVNLDELSCSGKALKPMATEQYIAEGMDAQTAYKKAKAERFTEVLDGYSFQTGSFKELGQLLTMDCAFSPFKFKSVEEGAIFNEKVNPNPMGGVRGKDNIASPAQFIVLDIDDDGITIDEAADMFEDYMYHMARTSNPDNPYKFRVLIPLSSTVDIDSTKWIKLMRIVGTHLSIDTDNLPQSQIFYGYAGRELISNYDGDCLDIMQMMKEVEAEGEIQQAAVLNIADRNIMMTNLEMSFSYAINMLPTEHSKPMIFRVMAHAKDLGFSYQENRDICEMVADKMPKTPDPAWVAGTLEQQRKNKYKAELDTMEDAY